MIGYNYLGTIDDMVKKYPWRFKVTEDYFNHSLVVQIINGKPILINDGYLMLHPIARKSIINVEGLLWELINSDSGFINVMTRGKDQYGLHEMPERMQSNIETYKLLVNDKFTDIKWKFMRGYLENMDKKLRVTGRLVNWPKYDMGSGFLALAQRLKDRNSSARSVGLAWHVKNTIFKDFLSTFIERMQKDTRGARNYWETLAKEFADRPNNLNSPIIFVRLLMNLANEMYHYNMGLMLSADYKVPISVETQASAAFDDLLITKDILVEEKPFIPQIKVPKILAKASPKKLVQILRPHTPVYRAREEWFELKQLYDTKRGLLTKDEKQDITEAAKIYARRLSEHLRKDVKYTKGEELFEYVVGTGVGAVLGEVTGQLAGVPYMGGSVGAATGLGMGFLVSKLQGKSIGKVVEKFRLYTLEKQILSPIQIKNSEKTINKIKRSRVPSSLEIDITQATKIAENIRKFEFG